MQKNIIIKGTCGTLGEQADSPCHLLHEPNVLHHNKRTENNWVTGSGYLANLPKKRMQFGGQSVKFCIEFCCRIMVEDVRLLNRIRQLTAPLIYVANPNTHTHTHTHCAHNYIFIHTLLHTCIHVVKTSVCIQIKRRPILWKSSLNAYLMLSTTRATTTTMNLNKS